MVDAAAIESIVRSVLKRMLASDSLAALKPTESAPASTSILRIDQSLITLASFPSDLTGVRELHLQKRAVVTPAARELLSRLAATR